MRRKPVVLTKPQALYLDAQVQALPEPLRATFRGEVFTHLSGTVGDAALMAAITTTLTDGYIQSHGGAATKEEFEHEHETA